MQTVNMIVDFHKNSVNITTFDIVFKSKNASLVESGMRLGKSVQRWSCNIAIDEVVSFVSTAMKAGAIRVQEQKFATSLETI